MAGIDRTAAAELFQESVAPNVVEQATQRSVCLATLPTIPMGDKTYRIPVLAALPTGGFLAADQDVKPQSAISWDGVVITAEEVACIVPISETVLDDSSINVVDKVTDLLAQEFGRIIDAAVVHGTGAPTTWPTGGLAGVAAAESQNVTNTGDLNADAADALAFLDDAGFDPNLAYAGRKLRSAIRKMQDAAGDPIFRVTDGSVGVGALYGVPLSYPLGWAAPALGVAEVVFADTAGVVMGLRKDVSIKILSEATLTGFGNLAEKDSIAVRATMRVGFQVANPVTLETGAQQYPVSSIVGA